MKLPHLRAVWSCLQLPLVVSATVLFLLQPMVPSSPNTSITPLQHQTQAKAQEIDRRFKQGVVMLHARQYDHAATALHRVLELAPNMPEAHINMGYAMLGLKRHAVARDFFSDAIELRPMQANAYYGLALALEAENDLAGAHGAMRSFVHLSAADGANNAFVRKAEAAMWEWQAARDQQKVSARVHKKEAARK